MNAINKKYNLVFIMFISILFSGCVTKFDRLEYALEFAGENRRELEKVLNWKKVRWLMMLRQHWAR